MTAGSNEVAPHSGHERGARGSATRAPRSGFLRLLGFLRFPALLVAVAHGLVLYVWRIASLRRAGRSIVGGRRGNWRRLRIGGFSIGRTGFAPTLLFLFLLLGEVSLTPRESVVGFCHG